MILYMLENIEIMVRNAVQLIRENEMIQLICVIGPVSVLIHWIAVYLYSILCVSSGFSGLLYSFMTMLTPQCIILSTIIQYSFYYYSHIWKYIIGSIIMVSSMFLKKIISE